MRFVAFSRMLNRLISAWLALALVIALPLGTIGAQAADSFVYRPADHTAVSMESDAVAVVLPAETFDEFDRAPHRAIAPFDAPPTLPVVTRIAVSAPCAASAIGSLPCLAYLPPGRGPPALS